jgi:hypothetical protein
MKALISKPLNDLQRQFNDLCEKGGGVKGGPVRGKTLELLKFYGQTLNKGASEEVQEHLAAFPDANRTGLGVAISRNARSPPNGF